MADKDTPKTTPDRQLAALGREMAAQDMNELAIAAWVGLGSLLGAFARIYQHRVILLRIAFVLAGAWIISTGKGFEILGILLQ